jgi:hypothetical protein
VYDDLPQNLLVQIIQILERAIGQVPPGVSSYSPSDLTPTKVWRIINNELAHELGVFDLAPQVTDQNTKFSVHLLNDNLSIDQTLDVIESAFRFVQRLDVDNNLYRRKYSISFPAREAIKHLNYRLRQHNIGYQFIAGEIIRVDSQYLHSEVVEPAISLLQEEGFSGALEEFMRAHQHYRHGEMQDALVDTNNALESTLKTVCERSDIALTGRETASGLIAKVTEHLIPSHMQSFLQALPNLIIAVSTLRNRPGIGHGAGSAGTDVSDHVTGYAINMTAATILFVVEAWKDQQENI